MRRLTALVFLAFAIVSSARAQLLEGAPEADHSWFDGIRYGDATLTAPSLVSSVLKRQTNPSFLLAAYSVDHSSADKPMLPAPKTPTLQLNLFDGSLGDGVGSAAIFIGASEVSGYSDVHIALIPLTIPESTTDLNMSDRSIQAALKPSAYILDLTLVGLLVLEIRRRRLALAA